VKQLSLFQLSTVSLFHFHVHVDIAKLLQPEPAPDSNWENARLIQIGKKHGSDLQG
jgi:beta-phosphoglucomutase-like phosphatase (HAD superfamily)